MKDGSNHQCFMQQFINHVTNVALGIIYTYIYIIFLCYIDTQKVTAGIQKIMV